jgi:hypothetical protein
MQDTLIQQQTSLEQPPKEQLPVVLSFLDDCRRIIEGGKGRRWEIFKWAFALNIALISATAAESHFPTAAGGLLFIAAIVNTFGAAFLIFHYDRRMNGARDRADNLYDWINSHIIDIHSTMGEPPRRFRADQKDQPEKLCFFLGIGGTFLVMGIALAAKRWLSTA